ncbi:MAG TPA: ATP-binding protein [Polyangiaceae bacterium]|nr:ATP-binding protein [Polyangiaceae bacterium]
MRGPRTLRSRLFSWFFGAIALAISMSALVVGTTRPEGTTGVEAAVQHMASRLAADWDDPESVRAYVEQVRDVTGFDVRLVRDAHRLPAHVRRAAERGASLAPGGRERVFVPVVRGGALVGALEVDRFGVRPAPWGWWRLALALLTVMSVLSLMASRVANLLARPLEQLAVAADRFGAGDLAYRNDVVSAPGWVAVEVRDVAVSYNRMADRVEAMVRGQRELLGAISHELRSPLARARVALEIARDRLPRPDASGDGPPDQTPDQTRRSPARALDDVEAQLGAIDRILGELLDVTRAGLADVRKESRALVEWLRARIAEEPSPPPIVLEVAPDAEQLTTAMDPSLMSRAVHNLLVNARAHGHPAEAPIVVRVSRHGTFARVLVADSGPGFPEGFAERAFEPFVRGDPARPRPLAGAGYGLGLAIMRRIVEAHGGRVFAGNRAPSHVVGEGKDGGAAGGGGGGGAEVGFDLPIAARPG